jgi:2-phosphosulfolactate phosphatase
MTRVALHWGPVAAREESVVVDCAVVVDVLSFTTTLSVAVDRGIEVLPYAWRDETAVGFARDHDAALAVARGDEGSGGVSLSPASVRRSYDVERLVLPSPNGSAICRGLASTGCVVLGACLRNATAVAQWIADAGPDSVEVVAAGERWPGGALRPALEDLLGAGAVIDGLPAGVVLSGDALAARASFREARDHLLDRLLTCASGEELVASGFGDDVMIAAELDSSGSVPMFEGDRFRSA